MICSGCERGLSLPEMEPGQWHRAHLPLRTGCRSTGTVHCTVLVVTLTLSCSLTSFFYCYYYHMCEPVGTALGRVNMCQIFCRFQIFRRSLQKLQAEIELCLNYLVLRCDKNKLYRIQDKEPIDIFCSKVTMSMFF